MWSKLTSATSTLLTEISLVVAPMSEEEEEEEVNRNIDRTNISTSTSTASSAADGSSAATDEQYERQQIQHARAAELSESFGSPQQILPRYDPPTPVRMYSSSSSSSSSVYNLSSSTLPSGEEYKEISLDSPSPGTSGLLPDTADDHNGDETKEQVNYNDNNNNINYSGGNDAGIEERESQASLKAKHKDLEITMRSYENQLRTMDRDREVSSMYVKQLEKDVLLWKERASGRRAEAEAEANGLREQHAAAEARSAEMARALQEGEDSIKQLEQMVWHAKAECSEAVYAYQDEKKRRDELQADYDAFLSSSTSSNSGSDSSSSSSSQLLPCALCSESIIALRSLEQANGALTIEANNLKIAANEAAFLSDSTAQLQKQLSKLEADNKNLTTIIGQLRQAKRVGTEGLEALAAEKAELEKAGRASLLRAEGLQRSLQEQSGRLEQLQQLEEEYTAHRDELDALTRDLISSKAACSKLEKELYDKSRRVALLESDMTVLREDLDTRAQELLNLHEALAQAQRDRENALRRQAAEHQTRLDAAAAEYAERGALCRFECDSQLVELQGSITALRQQVSDEQLLRRKAELDFQAEKKKLQMSVESTIRQLRGADSLQADVATVDRSLISNLIVNYIQKRRSRDVLRLIADVLSFTVEQKEAVGLQVPSTRAILSSLLGIVGITPEQPPEVEGDSLAELWVNFLLLESGEQAAGGADASAGTPQARSRASSGASNSSNSSGRSWSSSASSSFMGSGKEHLSIAIPPPPSLFPSVHPPVTQQQLLNQYNPPSSPVVLTKSSATYDSASLVSAEERQSFSNAFVAEHSLSADKYEDVPY